MEFTRVPGLPDNVAVVTRENEALENARYFLEHGVRTDTGKRGVSVIDFEPEPRSVTHFGYAFELNDGIFVHESTEVHRHDSPRDCSHEDPEDEPVTEEVVDILHDFVDAPVAYREEET